MPSAADLQRSRLLQDLNLPDSTALSLADLQQLSDANAAGVLSQVGTLAYVENTTTVVTAISALTLIPSTSLVVPASNRDIWLEWGGLYVITTAGEGNLQLDAYEGATLRGAASVPCGATSPAATNSFGVSGKCRVGPSAVTRTFNLYGNTFRVSGSLAGNVYNGAAPLQTWFAAVAR